MGLFITLLIVLVGINSPVCKICSEDGNEVEKKIIPLSEVANEDA
jgi:hypothetical protein